MNRIFPICRCTGAQARAARRNGDRFLTALQNTVLVDRLRALTRKFARGLFVGGRRVVGNL